MTISSQITEEQYFGNGTTTDFPFGNRVFSASDLAIYLDKELQTGGYQVENLDTFQAIVIFDVAPGTVEVPVEILIQSIIPIQQLTAFRNQQRFNADVHEDEFDRTNLRILSIAANLVKAVQIRPGEVATDENTFVPDLDSRIASFFVWDNEGNILAIKVADLLEYIGGTLIGAGEGLYSTFDAPSNTTTLHVGAGEGISVNADDVQISTDKLIILDNADYSNVGKNDQVLLPTDFNTLTRSGMFYMDAGALNNPNAADGCLLVIGADPLNTGQMFVQTEASGDYVRVFYRNQLAGVWGGWEQTVTTGNVLLVLNAAFISFVDDPEGVYDNVQDALAAALDAITTRFDPATTILTETNVQGAIEQIVSVLEFITSGVQFEGVWNADLNTPPIDTFTPNNGDFYLISVAGTTDLGGPDPAGDPLDNWVVGDIAIYDAIAGDNGYIGWNRRPVLGIPTHAATTVFDDTNYVLSFPGDLTPPQFVQPALDKVWPFAKQTLDSNVGRPNDSGLVDYANLLSAQFNTSNDTSVGHPATAEKVSIVSGLTDTLDTFGVLAITATGGDARAFYNTVQAGVLGDWQEAYLLTAPRTKANVDLILDNADAGHIGQSEPLQFSGDLNTIVRAGFYNISGATNTPTGDSGSLLVMSRAANSTAQIYTEITDEKLYFRVQNSSVWGAWIELSTGNLALYLPLVGGTMSGDIALGNDTAIRRSLSHTIETGLSWAGNDLCHLRGLAGIHLLTDGEISVRDSAGLLTVSQLTAIGTIVAYGAAGITENFATLAETNLIFKTAEASVARGMSVDWGTVGKKGHVGLHHGADITSDLTAILSQGEWNGGTRVVCRGDADINVPEIRTDSITMNFKNAGSIDFGTRPENYNGLPESAVWQALAMGSNGLLSSTNSIAIVTDTNGSPHNFRFAANGDLWVDGNVNAKNSTKAGQIIFIGGNQDAAVNFSNPLPDTDYAITFGQEDLNTAVPTFSNRTVNGFTIRNNHSAGLTITWMATPYNN